MAIKKMKLGTLRRNLKIKSDSIDADSRTVELSFSSEDPYERYFGIEILSHEKKHVLMEFMASGRAPFLADHNNTDIVGVIEKAWLQEGVGRARVRFGQSNRASEIFDDVVDGIRSNVSVGYHVHKMVLEEERDDGPDIYRVTKWEPVEASLVAVPADTTVGVGRNDDRAVETIIEYKERKIEMPKKNDGNTTDGNQANTNTQAAPTPTVNVDEIRAQERDRERNRQADIMAIGKMADMTDEALEAVKKGESVADFRAKAFDKLTAAAAQPAVDMQNLSENDQRTLSAFSFTKAIREAGDAGLSGLEKEMHQEGVKQLRDSGIATQGQLSIPYQVLAVRDLTAGTDNQGGYTVATNLLAASFIELLQNAMKVKEMGATVLDNLVGNVAIPSQATGATAAWEGENDAGSESSPTFGQLSLSPNRVGTYTEISKQLLVQSSLSVETLIRKLLSDSIALALDLAALHGTGSGNQPTGIAATSGIGSVAGGTNGLAPAFGHIVDLETEVAIDNADVGRMGYLTNAKVRGKLKQVFRNATYGDIPVWNNGQLNGYRAEVSNQVSATLDKGTSTGVCSAIFFGNWADLVLALWGGLDLVVDPYTLATTNLTRITANTYADVGVRHAASFAAMLDALTA